MGTLTRRRRPVQPRAVVKLDAPYLTSRPGAGAGKRWYFQPPSRHRKDGWAALRLHDQYERPIADELEAAKACRLLADIFTRWLAGEPGYGPHMIDRLGRVVETGKKAQRGRRFKPGEIGAMIADYKRHDVFTSKSAKTQIDYTSYLDMFVEEFGDTTWRKLAPGTVRTFLKKHATERGPAGAHAMYRTVRAFFGQVRLCYDDVDHPGFVPLNQNPMASLVLELPRSTILMWPQAAVDAFVALADAEGQPSIGDALVTMSWLGVRRQDWITWPADVFDTPLVAFRQEKTDVPNVLPWSIVPAIANRVAAAKERRRDGRRPADAVSPTTFFHDAKGRPWKDGAAFRRDFNLLRDKLAQEHASFPARYYVGLVAGDPLALPTAELTMRTMRHTCVSLNFDAGVPPHLIGGITGHSQDEIDEILAHYRARTADQAEAALQLRMAHERKGAKA